MSTSSKAPFAPALSHEAFVAAVQESAGLATAGAAAAAIRATLETLAEFCPRDAAARLAAHLPLEVRPGLLFPVERPDDPSLGEFCCRVTVRENTDVLAAMAHARAVLRVVCTMTSPELVREQLPAALAPLLDGTAA